MSERKRLPIFIVQQYGSARAFKAAKRAELRAVRKALDELRSGCACLPNGYTKVVQIERLLTEIESECSAKRWGR